MKKDLAVDLHRQLHSVRNELDISIQQFSMRVHATLAALIEELENVDTANQVRRLPSIAKLNAMREEIQALKVKPQRGRAKDLRRIDKLAADLSSLFYE